MQFCNEQIKTQPLFSPPCASATYGSARMCRRKNLVVPLISARVPLISTRVSAHCQAILLPWPLVLGVTNKEQIKGQGRCTASRVSARQGSMRFCPTKISLGPHFMSPKTLLYMESQCHYNMKGLRFGLVGPILIHWGQVMHICIIKISHRWFR